MSKLYMMHRMSGSPAAGDLLSSAIKGGSSIIKWIGRGFKSKAAVAAKAAIAKAVANPIVQTGLVVGGSTMLGNMLAGPTMQPPGSGGGGGSWGRRRRKGITATELRGFRKVAKLLHNEGMVIKKRRHA